MSVDRKLVRRIRVVLIVILAVALVPYGFSRLASSWSRISIHENSNAAAGKTHTGTLRVASYNIAHGRGLATSNWRGGTAEERQTRLRQIADLLVELDADIVVLNEVDFDSTWSSSVNQARYLANHAGYPYWAEQRNLDFRILTWKWRFGNAVLSRYPIVQASVVDLPGFSAAETLFAGKKRALNCRVELGGDQVRILAVHLCHRSEAIRARSAKMITEITSSDTLPTIVAGDFNSSPTGFPHSESDDAGCNAMDLLDASALFQRHPEQPVGTTAELTFHSTQPALTIDWILFPRTCRIGEYRVEPAVLSDHRPVVAELMLGPAAEAANPE